MHYNVAKTLHPLLILGKQHDLELKSFDCILEKNINSIKKNDSVSIVHWSVSVFQFIPFVSSNKFTVDK